MKKILTNEEMNAALDAASKVLKDMGVERYAIGIGDDAGVSTLMHGSAVDFMAITSSLLETVADKKMSKMKLFLAMISEYVDDTYGNPPKADIEATGKLN